MCRISAPPSSRWVAQACRSAWRWGRMGEPGCLLVGPEESTNHASTESSSGKCDEESFFLGIAPETRTNLAIESSLCGDETDFFVLLRPVNVNLLAVKPSLSCSLPQAS